MERDEKEEKFERHLQKKVYGTSSYWVAASAFRRINDIEGKNSSC